MSGDTATELAAIDPSESPFGEVAFAGLVLSGSTLTSWHHNQGWFDGFTAQLTDPGQWSDQQLIDHHQSTANTILANNSADRANGHYQNAIDHMGAVEYAMHERGMDVPDSGMDYTTAYNDYHNS